MSKLFEFFRDLRQVFHELVCGALDHDWSPVKFEGCTPITAYQRCLRCTVRRTVDEDSYYKNPAAWR